MGLRWRTQKEVVSGRGQFVCGAKVRVADTQHGPVLALIIAEIGGVPGLVPGHSQVVCGAEVRARVARRGMAV